MSPGINKNTMLQWKIIWSILFLLIFTTNVWAIGEITFEMGVSELSKQLVEGLGEEKNPRETNEDERGRGTG